MHLDVAFEGDAPAVWVDVTEAYAPAASRAVRGVSLVDGRRVALIQDQFTLSQATEVAWGMTTDAEIEINADGSALLEQDGKRLTVTALHPTAASFTVESAEREPPEKRNEGVRRLILRLPARTGDLHIAILLAPHWEDDGATLPGDVVPLADR